MTKKEAKKQAQELLNHVKDNNLNIELENKKLNFKFDKNNQTITTIELDKKNNVIDSTKYDFNKKDKNLKEDDKLLFEKGLSYNDFNSFSEFCCVVIAIHIINSPKIIKIDNEAIEKLNREKENGIKEKNINPWTEKIKNKNNKLER